MSQCGLLCLTILICILTLNFHHFYTRFVREEAALNVMAQCCCEQTNISEVYIFNQLFSISQCFLSSYSPLADRLRRAIFLVKT